MERRRRALGLKNVSITPEKNAAKSSRQVSTASKSTKHKSEDKIMTRGKVSQRSQPTGSVTPKEKTQISRSSVTPLKPESPCSPLQSPDSHLMFPGTLASPEIEVSWDWSCSQVPNEMLPPIRTKRMQDTKTQRPVLPTINIRPRPRPPLQQQITEEENQQRLEFYKQILSLRPSESSLHDSTNNNDVSLNATKLCTTPKRPITRLSSASKKKDEDNLLFDDSANEFMIECSQAIEEKLRNGEIDMGPIVDIKISQAKRLHSPGIESDNLYKKTCPGRVNLFPENVKCDKKLLKYRVDKNDHKPVNSDINTNYSNFTMKETAKCSFNKCEDIFDNVSLNDGKPSGDKTHSIPNSLNINEENTCNTSLNRTNSVHKPLSTYDMSLGSRLLAKPAQSSSSQSSINHMIPPQNTCTEKLQRNVNTTNQGTLDNVCIPLNSNNNQSSSKPQNHSINIIRRQQYMERQDESQGKEMQRTKLNCTIEEKSNTSDVTCLLDDGFDLELSCLDVDSLCRNSENKELQGKCVTTSVPKLCTQQEIEAKRKAALQKLMMKKKK